MADWRLIKAKRLSICEVCTKEFEIGTEIYWSRSRSVIRCIKCGEPHSIQTASSIGTPGKSAQVIVKKKLDARRERALAAFPKTGKLALRIIPPSKTTQNWEKGAKAEKEVGELINIFAKKHGFKVMHDRAVPDSKGNIDHIIISETGIFVVDTKNYDGKIKVKKETGRGGKLIENLYVNDYKKNNLIKKVKIQADLVQNVLTENGLLYPVYGTLAFFHGEFPLFKKPIRVDGIFINGRGLEKLVTENIPGLKIDVAKAFNILGKAFPDRS